MFLREFGRRFREVVEKTGQTQEEVGALLGVTQTYVSKLARGAQRPSLELLEKIIEVFKLPREEWLRLAEYRCQGDPISYPLADLPDQTIDRIADAVAERIYSARPVSEADRPVDMSTIPRHLYINVADYPELEPDQELLFGTMIEQWTGARDIPPDEMRELIRDWGAFMAAKLGRKQAGG